MELRVEGIFLAGVFWAVTGGRNGYSFQECVARLVLSSSFIGYGEAWQADKSIFFDAAYFPYLCMRARGERPEGQIKEGGGSHAVILPSKMFK